MADVHLRLVKPSEVDPAIEDDRLCRAFLRGDQSAFEELVRHHQKVVVSLVRRYSPNPEDAADLAQRAFLRAFEAARRSFSATAPGLLPFRAWLLRIAVNLAKNQARDSRRRPQVPLEAVREVESGGPSVQQRLEHRERELRVRAAVVNLPKREREVFSLRIDGELPFAEIAETLGITENNAKVCFHHAYKRLQALVANPAQKDEP
jgi:RNA polymerase sigma-70 factor (ECF subfamily)